MCFIDDTLLARDLMNQSASKTVLTFWIGVGLLCHGNISKLKGDFKGWHIADEVNLWKHFTILNPIL